MNKALLFLFVLLLPILETSAQIEFTPLNGPVGHRIYNLEVNDQGGIALSIGGAGYFSSVDQGSTWQKTDVSALGLDEGLLLSRGQLSSGPGEHHYAHYLGKLYTFKLGDTTWTLVGDTPLSWSDILEVSPEGNLFICRKGEGVWISEDGGQNFSQIIADSITADLSWIGFQSVGKDNNWLAIRRTEVADPYIRLYHFKDDGSELTFEENHNDIFDTPAVYSYPGNRAIVRFDDQLRLWDNGSYTSIPFLNFSDPAVMQVLPSGTIVTYNNSTKSLYTSNDLGQNWNLEYTFQEDQSLKQILYDSTKSIFYLMIHQHDETSLWKAENNFTHWERFFEGWTYPDVREMRKAPNDALLAKTKTRYQFSNDDGQNWSLFQINDSIAIEEVQIHFNGNYFVVGSDDNVYRSVDEGLNWSLISPSGDPPRPLTYLFPTRDLYVSPEGALLVSYKYALYRSDNLGNTWTEIESEFGNGKYFNHPNGTIFAQGYSFDNTSWLKRSLDDGQSWETILHGVHPSLDDLFISPRGIIYLYGNYEEMTNGLGIYTSDDNGTTFNYSFSLSTLPLKFPLQANKEGDLFFLSNDSLYISKNEAQSFEAIGVLDLNYSNLPHGILIDPASYMYVHTSAGVIHKSELPTAHNFVVQGQIYHDTNEDCQRDSSEGAFDNILVKVTGQDTFYYTPLFNGQIYFTVPPGDYTIEVVMPNNYLTSCQAPVNVTFQGVQDTLFVDFPIQGIVDCPYNIVSISPARLRLCDTATYYVNYSNQGPVISDSTYIEIVLDSLLQIHTASIPYIQLPDATYVFDLGQLDIMEDGAFSFDVLVPCDSSLQLGQTLCASAHIYPDSACITDALWNGASLEVKGDCINDSLFFEVKNIGSGNMSQSRQYIVIEDDAIMRTSNPFTLNSGESIDFSQNAVGRTVRVEVEQVDRHPGQSFPSISIEGCGDSLNSMGYINQFPLNESDPFIDISCNELINSYDPNDKQATPFGYDSPHFIKANTDLEYKIRFQNTGNDTAYLVVIRDTLSTLLNPESVQPGASSHPYNFRLYGPGILEFSFPNILLPDSLTDERGSQGFVLFRVAQRPDLADGEVIYNDAAIYFDFNPPVITNETDHTIGSNFIVIGREVLVENLEVLVFPNPSNSTIYFELSSYENQNLQFSLFDLNGRRIDERPFIGPVYQYHPPNLPAGIYFYQIRSGTKLLSVGKLLRQ